MIESFKKLKENRGAVSVLVFISVLTFLTVLLGVFLTVTTLRQGQLRSDKRLQEIYGKDIDNINDIYGELQVATNGTVTMNTTTLREFIKEEINAEKLKTYPVGSIYITTTDTNPSTFIGGTWEQIQDRFLIGAGNTYSANATGGNVNHTHTLQSAYADFILTGATAYENYVTVPSRQYSLKWALPNNQQSTTDNSPYAIPIKGNTDSSSNIPPYLAVYMWKRVS